MHFVTNGKTYLIQEDSPFYKLINTHWAALFLLCNTLVDPRGLPCEANIQEIMCGESFDDDGFDLGPLLQGQMRIPKLKSAYNLLIIGPRGL